MKKITNHALEYLLQGYKDDLQHYETKIEQYKRYAKNAKKNIVEIEQELKQREVKKIEQYKKYAKNAKKSISDMEKELEEKR